MTEHMKSPDADGDGEQTLCGIPERLLSPSLKKALTFFSGAVSGVISGCGDKVELRHDGRASKIVRESYKNEGKHSSGILDKGRDWASRTKYQGEDVVDTGGWVVSGILGATVAGYLLLKKIGKWFR